MSTTVFPINGAANAAELFALLAGHSNATDFVDEGLTVTVDADNNTATLSAGTCYIQLDADTITGTNEQVRNLGYVVQLDEQTVSIPDSGTVTLAVVPDYSVPNTAAIEYYELQSNVPPAALAIATVDCNTGTVDEYNRAPDIDANSLSVVGETTIDGELNVTQNVVLDGQLKQNDGTVLFGPDDPVPSTQLSDDSVTIKTNGDLTGGGSVSLGDSLTLDTTVPVTSVHGRTGAVSATDGDYTHEQIANVSNDDHHPYPVPNTGLANDSITVSTGGDITGGGSVTLGDTVTISADVPDRYTDSEAVTAVDGEVSTTASTVSGLDTQVSTNESAISTLESDKLSVDAYTPEQDTHTRYTDSEAISAANSTIQDAASTLNALDAVVADHDTAITDLESLSHTEQHNSDQHDSDSLHTDSVGIPSYKTTDAVPDIPRGSVVHIEADDALYIESQ